MGSSASACSHRRERSYTEMGVLSVNASDMLGLAQNGLDIHSHNPEKIDPSFSSEVDKVQGTQPQIKLTNKTENIEAQLVAKQPTRVIRQEPPDDRVLYPSADHDRKEGGNDTMTIDPYSSHAKKQPINIRGVNIDSDITDSEITNVLERLMASEDEEIKTLARRLLTKAVLPAASPGARPKHRRTRSLTSLTELKTYNLYNPLYGDVGTARKKTQPQLDRNINDDFSRDSSPSRLHFDDEDQSNKNFEYFATAPRSSEDGSSEKSIIEHQAEHEIKEVLAYSKLHFEKTHRKSASLSEKVKKMRSLSDTLTTLSLTKTGILRRGSETPNESIFSITELSLDGKEDKALHTSENDFPDLHEEELSLISKDIDEFEHQINETRAEISLLRRQSVNMLIQDLSDSEKDSDTEKVTESLSFLEIEQQISQLENKNHELETKRREALSDLQNKMLGNILGTGQKDLLPLLPVPIAASTCFRSQAPTSFEVRPNNSCQFSISKYSDFEASDVEESSVQRKELYHIKEEKPNEN